LKKAVRNRLIEDGLVKAAKNLCRAVERLEFSPPVAIVYNPLAYAWKAHETYLRRYGATRKRVIFLGMNPGPFGMVQTGIPFGEVNAVKNWLKIDCPIRKPTVEHPRRPIEGFACRRSEVSGFRLWGLFARRYSEPDEFFREHFVVNFCPLAFLEESGRNRTPDKLPAAELQAVYAACDRHLRRVVELLQPEWILGVGAFAAARAEWLFGDSPIQSGKILHPSPASPTANRGWAEAATAQLKAYGIW
jgi:single-strand selective monofunctional uracil DNA glycosylase